MCIRDRLFRAVKFGHTITVDHVIAAADKDGVGKGLGGYRYALCFLDIGTKYLDMVPVISRTAE
eukprot:8813719-Alexandrium_andersonii.AAC.1